MPDNEPSLALKQPTLATLTSQMHYFLAVNILLWCQSLSHHYCAKFIQNSEKIPDLFPLWKMLLSVGWKDPQEELNLDLIWGSFFHMADKSGYLIRFSAILVPRTLECYMLSYSEWPCGAILHQMFTLHGLTYANNIVRVYIFDLPSNFASAHKYLVVTKWLAP